ncbi:MAG: hypothetical protein IJN02_04040 [Bacteroidales bacterium]|nr:hypothetical protein [Bacteroidales bacterium]
MKIFIINITFIIVCSVSSCAVHRQNSIAVYPQLESDYQSTGILEERFHKCSSDGPSSKRMYVYLPRNYYQTTRSYPVVYLLHGAGGNENTWIAKGDILHIVDSLTRRGVIDECIIVVPNVNQYDDDLDYAHSRLKGVTETFFDLDGTVETAFVTDVVETVDSLYRTVADKEHRAIASLSIGGMQTIYITASNPDVFGYVGLFSPMIHKVVKKSHASGIYDDLDIKFANQFTSPPELYWMMVGRRDIFYGQIIGFGERMKKKGYAHEKFISSGGHDWNNWRDYFCMFIKRLWK